MTNREVYDFQPGDIFEYNSYEGSQVAIERDSVVSRTDFHDSMVYEVIYRGEYHTLNGSGKQSGQKVWKYFNLDSQVVQGVHIDHRSKTDSSKLGSKIDSMYLDSGFYNRISNSEILQDANHFEPSRSQTIYTAGLGMTFQAMSDEGPGAVTELYYYKKGSEEKGIPRLSTLRSIAIQKPALLVYPNPVQKQNMIYINNTGKYARIRICDINGREIEASYINAVGLMSVSIDEKYSTGLYILEMITDNGELLKQKFTVIP
jgi:hypothetical protein